MEAMDQDGMDETKRDGNTPAAAEEMSHEDGDDAPEGAGTAADGMDTDPKADEDEGSEARTGSEGA